VRPGRLLWHLYPSILLIVVVSMAAVGAYTSRSLRAFYLDRTRSELAARAELVKEILPAGIVDGASPEVDATVKRLGRLTSTRITIIQPSGLVIGDSDKIVTTMDNHATRPEVIQALGGAVGDSIRYSDTLRKRMMYVALPLGADDGHIHAIVRTALPLTAVESALATVYLRIAIGGFGIAILAALVTLAVSRRVSRPLEDLQRAALGFASGDLTTRIRASGSEEVVSLANAMNQMAGQLDDRIRAVVAQRNEREAVLAGMIEAVVAVDTSERVITLNSAAARLFALANTDALGRAIQEVARNSELQRFVAEALASEEPVEKDIVLRGTGTRFLQGHGAPLRDASGARIGAVVVLNDVTRLRRLESMRRDFVANVSHELKTPITSIKGFIETLSEGAIDDPTTARRFLDIASRQADRLNAIIEDLLSLSRVEEESEAGTVPLARERLRPLLNGALDVCRVKAEPKGITLELDCSDLLSADINAPLIEQAVVNLVDNAIKYSESGASVRISASRIGRQVKISVTDHGSGIEARHIPRLFERFYRVDKARSRNLGGTGLGLAIVKHIAQAHRGTVEVESEPGKGSCFTILVPSDQSAERATA